MNVKKYLERIQFTDEPSPSLDTLRRLQREHLLHIPFENLDIRQGKKIEGEKTYEKVILRNRGGFCYELNGLFYSLLTATGFKAKLVSARVYDKQKGYGPEFDHMAIVATVDGNDYLVDVGFGEFAFTPLLIRENLLQADPRGNFMIRKWDDTAFVVGKMEGEEFTPEYLFSDTPRRIEEFSGMCKYHQTSPESHFTQKSICSLPTETGRVTLSDHMVKITEKGKITETQLPGEAAFHQALWDYFRIKL